MKNQRGFTWIEIVGLVVVISIVALVAYPAINKLLKENSEKSYDSYKNTIIQATQLYVERNRNLFSTLELVGGTATIDCSVLMSNEYLHPNTKDPKTGKAPNCSVTVTVGSNKFLNYKYVG